MLKLVQIYCFLDNQLLGFLFSAGGSLCSEAISILVCPFFLLLTSLLLRRAYSLPFRQPGLKNQCDIVIWCFYLSHGVCHSPCGSGF